MVESTNPEAEVPKETHPAAEEEEPKESQMKSELDTLKDLQAKLGIKEPKAGEAKKKYNPHEPYFKILDGSEKDPPEEEYEIPEEDPDPMTGTGIRAKMEPIEKLEKMKELKEEGNQLFKQKDYAAACVKYERIDDYVKAQAPYKPKVMLTKEETQDLIDTVVTSLVNLSICRYNMQHYKESRNKATEAIRISPTIKAYYRRAVARAQMKEFEEACNDLKAAIKLDPSDPNNCQAQLDKFKIYSNRAVKEERAKLKKVFDKGVLYDEKANKEKEEEKVKQDWKESRPYDPKCIRAKDVQLMRIVDNSDYQYIKHEAEHYGSLR